MERITTVPESALPYIVLFTHNAIERFLFSYLHFTKHNSEEQFDLLANIRMVKCKYSPANNENDGSQCLKLISVPNSHLLKPSALLNDKPTWSPQTLSYDNIVSAAINMCTITDEGSMLPKMLRSSFVVEKMTDNTTIAICHYYLCYKFLIKRFHLNLK